jgi:hypothetical protein
MSAKSSTSSAPGDCRLDERPTANAGLSRAKSMKRSGQAAGGASAGKTVHPLPLRTATILTAGRGYRGPATAAAAVGSASEAGGGSGHLDGCLVIWNQKLQ